MVERIELGKRGFSWRLRSIGTIVLLGLLLWLLSKQDWRAILEAIQTLPAHLLFLSMLLLLMRYLWNTIRWLILLHAQGISLPLGRALALVFAGLFVSNFLPGMVGGDVVRIAGMVQEPEKRVEGAASVVVDRLIGFAGMLFFLPFSLPLIQSLMNSGMLFAAPLGMDKSSLIGGLRRTYEHAASAIRIWLKKPIWLLFSLLASCAGFIFYSWFVLLLADGLGMAIRFKDIAGVSSLVYFLTLIPLSINGYGIRELAMVAFYTHFAASMEQATALALITRFFSLFVSLPGAIWVSRIVPQEARLKESINPEDLE